MHFDSIFIYTTLIILGLMSGSFAGASVWRLRARQLKADKADGEKINESEYETLKKISNKSFLNDRSKCLKCSYQLKWYDLIPLFSWISLKGRCRKCKKPIGYFEPTIELSVAAYFILSFAFWPQALLSPLDIFAFVLWLVSGVLLAILFAYDLKWFLLPDIANFSLIGLGLVNAAIVLIQTKYLVDSLISISVSIVILSGIYWLLYLISKGRWIGFGDIKLGLGMALLLVDWKLAFLALFVANLIGCIIVIPPMMVNKLKRDSHIPFGPLLIMGLFIAKIAGDYLVSLYIISL